MPTSHKIKSIQVEGGFLTGSKIVFDDRLNCLIGGRGTGKTTVLELIRYVLGFTPDSRIEPVKARELNKLISANLGDANSITLEIETLNGLKYTVKRKGGDEPLVIKDDAGQGDISLRVHSQDDLGRKSSALSIDFSCMVDAIRGLIPGGPAFDPELAPMNTSDSGTNSISPDALLQTALAWENSTAREVSRYSRHRGIRKVAADFLRRPGILEVLGLSPEELTNSKLPKILANRIRLYELNEPISKRSYRLISFLEKPESKMGESTKKKIDRAENQLVELLTPPLWYHTYPGISDLALSDLQFSWDKYLSKFSVGETDTSDNQELNPQENIRRAVEHYMSVSSAILCAILVPVKIYIPRLPKVVPSGMETFVFKDFIELYMSTPMFWIMQNVISAVCAGEPDRELFSKSKSNEPRNYLAHLQSTNSPIRVFLSGDKTRNSHWLSVMSFFGMHPTERFTTLPSDWNNGKFIDVKVIDSMQNTLIKFFNSRLEHAEFEPAIQRAQLWNRDLIRITSINLSNLKEKGLSQNIIFKHKDDPKQHQINIDWIGYDTVSLGFLGCSPQRLLDNNNSRLREEATKSVSGKDDSSFNVTFTKISAKQGAYQVEPEPIGPLQDIVTVFKVLYNEHTVNETRAMSRIGRGLTHELNAALPAIDSLLKRMVIHATGGTVVSTHLAPDISTVNAEISLSYLKFLACAYGSKDVKGDLLHDECVVVEDVMTKLSRIAVTLGIGLAGKGGGYEKKEMDWNNPHKQAEWVESLVKLIVSSFKIDNSTSEIFLGSDIDMVEYRIGFEAIVVSILANCVQHLVYTLAKLGEKPASIGNNKTVWEGNRISVHLSETELIIDNIALKPRDQAANVSNNLHQYIGSVQSLNFFLSAGHFNWSKSGNIVTKFLEKLDNDNIYRFRTSIKLPEPIWRRH